MGEKITLRLLFVIALLVFSCVGVKAEARKFSSEINRKLKLLNKPAIKSIKLDAYQTTGCINLICSGFVQTNQKVGLGAAIQPTSQKQGNQYEIIIRIDQDPNTRRWWLQYGDEVVGYWPPEILNYLKQNATIVQWGGDVYSKNMKGVKPHTTTAMGSGEYASDLLGEACFIENVRILDYSLQVKYPEWVHSMAEEPDCYSSLNYQKSLAYEPMFYFGGPGRGLYCP